MDKKEQEDFMIECVLENIEGTCDHCKETSIYVRPQDTSYRNASLEPHMTPLCLGCYIEYVVEPMDEMWAEYYRNVL